MSILIIFLFSCKKRGKENNKNTLAEYEEHVKVQIDKIMSENKNKQIDVQEFYWDFDSLNRPDRYSPGKLL